VHEDTRGEGDRFRVGKVEGERDDEGDWIIELYKYQVVHLEQ
jgi:hypothetical protein